MFFKFWLNGNFSVNVNNNIFWGRKVNDNVCCSFSRQMFNWKLPDVNLSLNGCKLFNWKSDVLYFFKMKKWRVQYDFENFFFQSQIWRVVNISNRNLTRIEIFNSKICFLRKAAKMQNMSFSRSKMNQNVIFWMQTFFQNLTCPKIFNSKSNALYFFQSKIWRFVKLLNQNLTRFEIFFQNLTRWKNWI